MSTIGKPERETQNRVIALFRDELGYRYLGDRSDRPNNSNIDEELLAAYLVQAGYTLEQISRAIYLLRTEAENPNRSLYDNNKAVYCLLRYGVPVKIEAGKVTETVKLIDWEHPEKNDFVIVEEVTLRGNYERRPDLVLYVNGIAVGGDRTEEQLRLHRRRASASCSPISRRSSTSGFSPRCRSSSPGNDSEGLRYGTIKTEEKYFLKLEGGRGGRHPLQARQVSAEDVPQGPAHRADARLRALRRRHEEAAARAPVFRHQGGAEATSSNYLGGIIWHTQGSGKSIVMVLLGQVDSGEHAQRPRAHPHRPRRTGQTDRAGLRRTAGEAIYRTSSGHDLMAQLGQAKPRLLCSLVHKFGQQGRG